jgi:hypothetical protein
MNMGKALRAALILFIGALFLILMFTFKTQNEYTKAVIRNIAQTQMETHIKLSELETRVGALEAQIESSKRSVKQAENAHDISINSASRVDELWTKLESMEKFYHEVFGYSQKSYERRGR